MKNLSDDVMRQVLGSVNVRTLLMAAKSCKRLRALARMRGVLHGAVLNTFPGMLDLPAGKDYCFYLGGISRYKPAPVEGIVLALPGGLPGQRGRDTRCHLVGCVVSL